MIDRKYEEAEISRVNFYLDFLSDRLHGRVVTGARYQRDFVLNHPDYNKDSIVSSKITYDLIKNITEMNESVEARA